LDANYDAKHRAGAFFIALGFIYCLVFSCVVENIYRASCPSVVPAHEPKLIIFRPAACGNDLAALLPRFMSVKRGFFICIVRGFLSLSRVQGRSSG